MSRAISRELVAELTAQGYYALPCPCGFQPAPLYGSHTPECVEAHT